MSSKKSKILVVDDDRSLSAILVNILDYEGYSSDVANDGASALSKMEKDAFDLILLDLKLPDISGMTVLEQARKEVPPIQVVMISAQATINTAVEATRIGAYDFLEKPLDSERVLVTIKNALEKGRLEREKAHLLQSVKEQYAMVGESDQMQHIRDLVMKAATIDSKVLIEGENGTGKELVARAIYINSKRAGGPFVAVNCAAIPDTLIESELFGYKKGAFTGAVTDKIGRFQMAEEGTLFFDEVGDMSLMTQAKVLRALEEGVIEMIGGKEPISVDVRVIAATNKDLPKEMKKGKFREDLYYRLNVFNIQVPPLRDRKEDIPLLVNHYIQYYCHEHGMPQKEITSQAMAQLVTYSWPGNIRELKNTVEKLVVLVEDKKIQAQDVASTLMPTLPRNALNDSLTLKKAKEEFEKAFIREKLIENDWNVSKTAQVLDIPRTYLHSKIKKFALDN